MPRTMLGHLEMQVASGTPQICELRGDCGDPVGMLESVGHYLRNIAKNSHILPKAFMKSNKAPRRFHIGHGGRHISVTNTVVPRMAAGNLCKRKEAAWLLALGAAKYPQKCVQKPATTSDQAAWLTQKNNPRKRLASAQRSREYTLSHLTCSKACTANS